jgi:hypothetical protein
MKLDPRLETLRDLLWRRPLTADEEVEWLRLSRAAATDADGQLEARLSAALGRLPDAPMPSNFTARVLQEIERNETRSRRRAGFPWPALRRWWPRLAVVCAVLTLSVFSVRRIEVVRHQRMAESVAALAPAGALPTPEALADFEAIRRLGNEPSADVELLTLMQ